MTFTCDQVSDNIPISPFSDCLIGILPFEMLMFTLVSLCADRLSLLLAKERSHPQTYIGCMKKGPVFTDPKLKWYEPQSFLLGSEYFLHAYGPIYALSADVVASLVALRNNRWVAVNIPPILSWNTKRSVPCTFYLHIFLIILSKCGGLSYQISLCNTCTNFWETVLAGITGIHVLSTHNYRCRVCLELRHKSWCGGIPAYAMVKLTVGSIMNRLVIVYWSQKPWSLQ